MITLISGEPGNGKTAYAVSQLLKESRPIYVWGIPALTIEHVPCPPKEEWAAEVPHPDDPSVLRPRFTFPDGALIVVDEAQDVFRPRPPGSKVPIVIQALETHRHQGLDIWLITQRPTQIDSAVRALVGRHVHLKSDWSGRSLLEWSCASDLSPASRASAVERRYQLPKEAFGLYKSASMHIKPSRRRPLTLYFLVLLLPALGLVGWWVWGRLYDRTHSLVEGGAASRENKTASPPAPKASAGGVPAEVMPSGTIKSVSYVKVGARVVVDDVRVAHGDVEQVISGALCTSDKRRCVHDGIVYKR